MVSDSINFASDTNTFYIETAIGSPPQYLRFILDPNFDVTRLLLCF